jgi:hypothetical protein
MNITHNDAEQVTAMIDEEHRNNPFKIMALARSLGVPSLGLSERGRCDIEFPDASTLHYSVQFRVGEWA